MRKGYLQYIFIYILMICVSVLLMSCGTGTGVEEEGAENVGEVGSVTVAAGSSSIVADGSSLTFISATVLDDQDNAVDDGTTVRFTTTAGTLSSATATTTDGVATITLTSPTNVGSATITATAGGVSAETSVGFTPGAPAGISLTATPNNLTADGSSTSTIRASVTDAYGNTVTDGETISFSVTTGTGTLSTPTALTSNGVASVTYTASDTAGTETVTAEAANGTSNTVNVTLIAQIVGTVTINAGSSQIVADGTSQTVITATIKDTNGHNISDGTAISFTTTAGTLSSATATTTNGVAMVFLTSPTNVGSAMIIATAGGVSDNTTVIFIPGAVAAIALTATPNNLTGDGSSTSTIKADVTDAQGNAVANGETISFSVTTGTGTLSPSTATTSNGIATVTYTASYAAGTTETVTAEATNGITNTVDVTLIAQTVGTVTINAGSSQMVADGASQTVITATVKDTGGNNISDGTTVSYTTTAGTLSSATATTTNGVATISLTSPTNVGSATVTATAGGVSANTAVSFVPGAVAAIALTATPNNLTADGSSTSTIRAMVTDAQGNAVANGETITFSVTTGTGTLSAQTATTTNGVATVTYTASDTAGTETVTAEAANGTSNTVDVTLIVQTVGSVTVTAISAEIVADGTSQTVITATVKDTGGHNISDGTTVNFTATAGTLSSASDTTTNGVATVTLTSPTNLGSATITATAGAVSGNTTVSFVPGAVAAISLTATPNNLTADGSSTSTIRASVTDAQGHAVANGETISFSVTAGTGTLSSPTATTTNGVSTVIYTASTTAGTETVTAEAVNGTLNTVDVTLIDYEVGSVTVNTGSPEVVADGASFTLVTATAKDTGGNNVPNGTTISFTTTAGTLSSLTDTTTNGVATVTLTSPTNLGSATITATAGGVSANTTVSFIPGAPATVTVTATPGSLTADGASTSSIKVTVLDGFSNPVADGETLSFSALDGTFLSLIATTSGGMATNTYIAPNYVPASGNDTITVETTNGQSGTAVIILSGPEIATITLSANPTSLPADGLSEATIRATVTLVGGGDAPDGTTVDFSIEEGESAANGYITGTATTAGGVATATLTAGNTTGTVTIHAEAGGAIGEIQMEYVPGSVSVSVVPNSLLGTGVETATVTATLKDAGGSPAPDGETVNFTLDDMSLGSIPSSATTTGGQGEATVTFQAAAKGGTVTVSATWTTGGVDVTGSETITIQPPPGYMEVTEGSPDPASINIKGTGGQSTSLITFDVKDIQGDLVADGYRVDFTILTGPDGGEEISPLFATTTNGQVSTILRSGFKSGPVSIKATYYYDTSISTSIGQISIVAGPPVGEEFGIAAEYLNISGLWLYGLEDVITISANDVYGNAVPDNTSISFKTYETGGDFDPGSSLTSGGYANSTLISYAPDPAQGFVSVTAEAINGGRTTHVTSLAVTPSPSNHIIYAGTDGGGVYKSTDSGTTWQNVSRSSTEPGQNWIDPYVNDVAVDPDDVNTVYAAAGYLGGGHVYRSLDGGINWNSNHVEEWNGILEIDGAVLSLLCDDGGSDYVWLGSQGLGALYATDGEAFQWGGIVNALAPTVEGAPGVYSNPLNTGDGTMFEPILSATSKTETWTVTYQSTGAEASTPVLDTSGSGSNADGTMTDVSATSTASTETWTITYTGGVLTSALTPGANTGNGTGNVLSTTANTLTETWTVECITAEADGGTFRVWSTQSGIQGENCDITSGNYTAYDLNGNPVVTFYILDGTTDFVVGDTFTFDTIKDGWSVLGSVSGLMGNIARTDIAYTSDNDEVSFTINSGANRFYKNGDTWTFDTTITGNWLVAGSFSGTQIGRAENNQWYSSDGYEVTFAITEGLTPFALGDEFTFDVTASGLGYGKTVRDIVKVPGTNGSTAVLYAATATGVFRSINGGQTWTVLGAFTGYTISTLALHPLSDGTTDIIYAGTVDAGVWVSTDTGATWTRYADGMGEGLSASTPFADTSNTGTGIMSEVTVYDDALSEYWDVTCITAATDGGIFSVTGTVSGSQANATVGVPYTSDGGEMSFTISDGAIDFEVGDSFTFSTTRDPGNSIKDLLVDQGNNQLYALTYFEGPLVPHPVGNVYAHGLNVDGSMAAGDWAEANTNLPEFDPPDDVTLFAQHVIAPDIPGAPTALYIGGEGINLYKATSGLNTGDPAWQQSKSGLTNLIMARMPILFSGECSMSIAEEVDGNNVTFTVYIEDENGNPPIAGSTFSVKHYMGIILLATYLDLSYPDCYTHQGTWRDPSDPATNDPYVFYVTVGSGESVVFSFTPACEADAPGCSGSSQQETYAY